MTRNKNRGKQGKFFLKKWKDQLFLHSLFHFPPFFFLFLIESCFLSHGTRKGKQVEANWHDKEGQMSLNNQKHSTIFLAYPGATTKTFN